MTAIKQHMQVGKVHFYFHECTCNERNEHQVVIKYPGYKHTILHGEANLSEAKIHAVETALKLGLISLEQATEALSSLN